MTQPAWKLAVVTFSESFGAAIGPMLSELGGERVEWSLEGTAPSDAAVSAPPAISNAAAASDGAVPSRDHSTRSPPKSESIGPTAAPKLSEKVTTASFQAGCVTQLSPLPWSGVPSSPPLPPSSVPLSSLPS